jgi:hypothetical protein
MSRHVREQLPEALMALGLLSSDHKLSADDVVNVTDVIASLLAAVAIDAVTQQGDSPHRLGMSLALVVAELLGQFVEQLAAPFAIDDLEMADQSLCHEGDRCSSEVALSALVRVKRAGMGGARR